MKNPLLQKFDTPFELPPFSEIQVEHYLPAVKEGIDLAKNEIDQIAERSDKPTFENTIEALEYSGEVLGRVSSVLFNLNSAETSDSLQEVAREVSPMLSEFDNEVKQNQKLWSRIKEVYLNRTKFNLSGEQLMLLEKTYKNFVRSGADLDEVKKARFKEVSIELSRLTLEFGENVLAETNSYELVVEKAEDLAGLPEDVIARAAHTAEKKGKPGKWVFTLQAPSYIPFMEYGENRELRKTLFSAYMTRSLKGDNHDNQEIVRKITRLRAELATLLGYKTYADYVLEERMAKSPTKVRDFLKDLLERALPKAKDEKAEIEAFMKKLGVTHELQRWDWSFYSEKLRKEKYNLDDEMIKPYFKLENVIEGVFKTAERLFDISFKRNHSLPLYHQEVEAYEVLNRNGETVAVFLADFFPREGKRGGAWMTSFREQRRRNGKKIIPQVSIVCNFTPSTEGHPSLLKFDEVKTLFHEFGHALHGMLADTTYPSLSGTSVYWDFVELPSQIFENWCYEKECLDLFAHHYQTGELIPEAYIHRLIESSTYHEAYATVRQISFGLLDMTWHDVPLEKAGTLADVRKVEREAFSPTDLFPPVEGNMSVQFSHIFGGGYAAGYYSYKWAEVLDADAFSLFQKNGVFDKATAKSFQENILSRGGTEHPMILYKRFRGQEPTPDALLARAGLIHK